LKLASQRFGGDIRVASSDPSRWIGNGQLPNVALIRFNEAGRGEAIGRLLGRGGEGHAIVVIGYRDGQWILGDPAVGRISWSDADFRRRFTGDALYVAH
jgi:hypothetical protein